MRTRHRALGAIAWIGRLHSPDLPVVFLTSLIAFKEGFVQVGRVAFFDIAESMSDGLVHGAFRSCSEALVARQPVPHPPMPGLATTTGALSKDEAITDISRHFPLL